MSGSERQAALDTLARLDRETGERLRHAQSEVDRLQAELDEAKDIRRGVIEEALAQGWTQAKVGRSLGMTRQRVAQLRVSNDA
jgi:DNA-directed RNA polymerase specialized sigma subunit